MSFHRRMYKLTYIFLLTILPSFLLGQVTAGFNASTTSGCPPLVVSFTNTSTATGGITLGYDWDDGTNFSTLTNPVLGYTTPGTYVVTLTAYDVNNSSTFDTETITITVYSKPNVVFTSSPSSGCAPLEVQFNSNSSTAGSGTITSRFWDFGNGNTGSGATPTHTYTGGGSFTPSLKITNSFGCSKTVNAANNIVASSGPTPTFTSSTHQACAPPLTVNFTGSATGGASPYTYNWDLDVSTSSNQNPAATYTSAGFYDITLIVTDDAGCSDTLISPNYVVITSVDADFDVTTPACKGSPINVTNNSVGASSFAWNWGDNSNGNGPNPSKSYSAGGTYTITLTASSGNCSDTHTETIAIQEITPSFTTTPDYFCQIPYTSAYSNTSTVNFGSIVYHEWRWEHFDGTNTVTTIDTNGFDTITRYETSTGYFDDTLIVVSSIGCTAQLVKPNNVLIEKFDVGFIADPPRGCAPDTVDFTDNTVPTASYAITSWFWDFDNGTTSTLQNPSNIVFQDTGCYFIKLRVENAYGCVDSVYSEVKDEHTVCYGYQPTAAALFTEDSICGRDSAWFYDNTLDTFANEFFWNFSDDTYMTGDSVLVTFKDTGWINLQYVVGHHGCRDTIEYDSVIYIKGPIIKFSPIMDCDSPMVRVMDAYSFQGIDRFYWNFGDSTDLDSVNQNAVHTYAESGTYNITITAYNDSFGCSDKHIASVFVKNLQAEFGVSNLGQLAIDSVACAPASFQFSGDSCVDELPQYLWFIDGAWEEQTQPNLTHYFTSAGFHEVVLVVHDANQCFDTARHTVYLSKPAANFTFDYGGGCDPVDILFSDNSNSDTTIVDWQWDFGNGSFDTTGSANTTEEYGTEGTYPVILEVTDAIGCKASKVRNVLVKFPYVGFYMDTVVCQLSNHSVLNQSIGDSLTFYWSFGNNTSSTLLNPVPTIYTIPGEYEVYLAIEDDLGCKDTAFKSLSVKPKPVVDFTSDTAFSPCLPLFVIFQDLTEGDELATWQWDFGDGNVSSPIDTNLSFHTYNEAGEFDVTLTVTSDYGCVGSKTIDGFIDVSGPYAEFGIEPDSGCIGDEIEFYVKEELRVAKYTWVFGDGHDTTVTSAVTSVFHAYDRVGVRTPIAIYYDSLDICEIPFLDTVYIHEVEARYDFVPDSVGCGRLNTKLINNSVGADTWTWDLGDGVSSEDYNPKRYFAKPGKRRIMLTVENVEYGCTDTISKLFVVHPTPIVEASADTLICNGDSTTVFGKSEDIQWLSWQWEPSVYVANDTLPITRAFPDTTTYMKVYAIDTNGCAGVDSVKITVQDTPRIDMFRDTNVIIGEVIVLNPRTDDEITYEWRPPSLLSCTTCPYPAYKATTSQTIYLTARDIYGCFEQEFEFNVHVDEKYTLDVPSAFSPNGDGVNDVIYARGWGIEELLEFKIYNRWGHEVFTTNSLHTGWDGTYRGKDQGMDTYAYIVVVKKYNGEESKKEGFIELIR